MQQISWWGINFDQLEVQRITDAIANEHISQGPVTAEFERQLGDALAVPYVAATTSGSTIGRLIAADGRVCPLSMVTAQQEAIPDDVIAQVRVLHARIMDFYVRNLAEARASD